MERLSERSAVFISWTGEWASGIGRLSGRLIVSYHGLMNADMASNGYRMMFCIFSWTDKWASGIARLSVRFDVSFHGMTNGLTASECYPKILLYIFMD